MANLENNKPANSVLGALAAGEPIVSAGSLPDPDNHLYHPAEDFALAWLSYWRAIGNHVLADSRGLGWFSAELAGLEGDVPQADLPPHLRLWNNDMRAGAQRAMEVLLYAVPGGRDAVRQIVAARGS